MRLYANAPYSFLPMQPEEYAEYAGENGQVVIEDNGPGFAPEDGAAREPDARVGLNNVRGRLELISGGRATISPRPGGGTVVTIDIPDRP